MARQAPPTVKSVIADRLRYLRTKHQWSQEELAARMTDAGIPWVRSTVAKIEATEQKARDVSAEELVCLAYVLGVSPNALITPTSDTEVRIAPRVSVPVRNLWFWTQGNVQVGGGYVGETLTPNEAIARRRFHDEAAPDFVVEAERRLPGLRKIQQLAVATSSLASPPPGVNQNEINVIALLEDLVEECKARLADARRSARRSESKVTK